MKTNLTTWLRRTSAGLLLGGVTLLAPGCTVHHEVAYESGPYAGYYDYDYYPEANVYFYPAGGVYYWHDGHRWTSGRRLPNRYVLHESREHFRGQTREPWTEHRGHEEHERH